MSDKYPIAVSGAPYFFEDEKVPRSRQTKKYPYILIGITMDYDSIEEVVHIKSFENDKLATEALEALNESEKSYRKLFYNWLQSFDKSLVKIKRFKEFTKIPQYQFMYLRNIMEDQSRVLKGITLTNEELRSIIGQPTFFDTYGVTKPVSYDMELRILKEGER